MKRMIALRKQHQVFGRGTIEFIRTDNRKVLTYLRRYGKDLVLCIANLSRTVQPVRAPLSPFAGLTPIEMLGQTEFPKIGDEPYFLTLAPYGFYWFQLQEVVTSVTARTAPVIEEPSSAVPALFAGVVWDSVLDGSMRGIIERQALVPFLERQRWFGGKARPLRTARFVDWSTLRRGAHPAFLTVVEAEYADGGRERYALPLAMSSGADAATVEQRNPAALLARITGARKGALYDGIYDDGVCATLLAAIQEEQVLPARSGELRAANIGLTPDRAPADALVPISRTAPDQSNTSVLFGHRLIMKLFRKLEAGPNPEVEIGEFLARGGFTRVPPLRGTIAYARSGQPDASLAMLQEYVPNQGNGWQVTINELNRYFDRVTALPDPRIEREEAQAWIYQRRTDPPAHVQEAVLSYLPLAEALGRRTGELHVALAGAARDEEEFVPAPFTPADAKATAEAMRRHADEQLRLLETALPRLDDRRRELARAVLAHRGDLLHQFDDVAQVRGGAPLIRVHGDFHLGQVLVTEGDVVILDFEGEPARPLAERRARSLALRDVAGMLRSFSYAALTGLGAATATRPEDAERFAPWADLWETWAGAAFLRAYFSVARERVLPLSPDDLDALLHALLLDKALYELGYELNNRPDWVHIPLAGLLRLRSRSHA
jgi:maltose alpha-D-glucosyltransferase/alpha-amylase